MWSQQDQFSFELLWVKFLTTSKHTNIGWSPRCCDLTFGILHLPHQWRMTWRIWWHSNVFIANRENESAKRVCYVPGQIWRRGLVSFKTNCAIKKSLPETRFSSRNSNPARQSEELNVKRWIRTEAVSVHSRFCKVRGCLLSSFRADLSSGDGCFLYVIIDRITSKTGAHLANETDG